jgi:hypothetical protein
VRRLDWVEPRLDAVDVLAGERERRLVNPRGRAGTVDLRDRKGLPEKRRPLRIENA